MGYKVVWSSKAIDDVDAIASYIARDSVSYAAAVVHRIINVTRNLISNPLGGEVVEVMKVIDKIMPTVTESFIRLKVIW